MKTIDYKAGTPSDWGVAASKWKWLKDDALDAFVLEERCPRCFDKLRVVLPVARTFPGIEKLGPEDKTIPVRCECNEIHPGAPEGKSGCGAYGRVPLPGMESIASLEEIESPITMHEMKWLQIAEEEYFRALPNGQLAANKLAGVVTGAMSLLAVLLIFVGPNSTRQITDGYRKISEILVIAAAFLGVLSATIASFAAVSRPSSGLISGALVRKTHLQQVETISKQVRISRLIALVALGLVVAVGCLAVVAPSVEQDHLFVVVTDHGETFCGRLTGNGSTRQTELLVDGLATPVAISNPRMIFLVEGCQFQN